MYGRNIVWVYATIMAVALCMVSAQGLSQNSSDREVVRLLLERPLEQDFIPGQIIVKLKTTQGEGSILQMLQSTDMASMLADKPLGITSGGELLLSLGPDLMDTQSVQTLRDQTLSAVKFLNDNSAVEYAEPNYIMQIVREPSDPHYADQWHYFKNGASGNRSPGGISLPAAWEQTLGDRSVVVAVLDTGILPDHPDIVGSENLLHGFDMISHFGASGSPDIANDGDGRDDNPTDPGDGVEAYECGWGPPDPLPNSWHGTHVAGTVGVGNTDNSEGVAGVVWTGSVLPVRVLGKCGGATNDIVDGIRWAAGLSVPGIPDNLTPASVINLSLGGLGSCPNTYQRAIGDAIDAGSTVVVAAGNSTRDAAGYTPASCEGVITVAASDFRGNLARYSNYGSAIEILAPGGDVWRDDNNDAMDDGVLSMVDPSAGTYAFYNGTSMAAPHVSGVVALMLAVNRSLTPDNILEVLQGTAIPRSSAECPVPCGAGLLNAEEAVSVVR